MLELGFHTDAFTSFFWSFDQCLAWAQANDIHWIECGMIDGVSWIHGLGYHPHVALWQDPVLLRHKMDRYDVAFSQLDAAFPLSTPEGPSIGVEYILHTIPWAKLAGCPRIDTTDDHRRPAGMTDREVMAQMKKCFERILRVAEAYQITVNIEPHGYYTTKPEFLEEMLSFVDSPFLRLNLDIGNVFIANQDPVAFTARFQKWVSHVHVKDISDQLAANSRGALTGIANSHCAIGEGANAANVRRCIELLAKHGYQGVLTIECEAHGDRIERSVAWMRSLIREIEQEASNRATRSANPAAP